jgi:hypothetical protein
MVAACKYIKKQSVHPTLTEEEMYLPAYGLSARLDPYFIIEIWHENAV